ncbi:MAG TPA: hypothetical protein VNT51_03815 [Miltoncostaeaceae bacterium]|jgi:hypothetical protein|nr:hypothetical protein [Miltoncostaeaceae bacterium]
MAEPAITPQQIRVREVTHYQVSWTEAAPGEPSVWTLQLVLDNGVEEHVIRPTADDLDVMKDLLAAAETVFFDQDRRVLMFGNRAVG